MAAQGIPLLARLYAEEEDLEGSPLVVKNVHQGASLVLQSQLL